jgi:hypothetical protein
LRTVDTAANNAAGCHEGACQPDHRWMGESRPRLGRDYVNRHDSGGYGQSQDSGPNLAVLAGNVLSPTSGQGAPRKPAERARTAVGGRATEGAGMAEGSGQG